MDWASEFLNYLQLYGNCDTVHMIESACVAALIFEAKADIAGGLAIWLAPSGTGELISKGTSGDLDFVASEKQKQLDFHHTVFN